MRLGYILIGTLMKVVEVQLQTLQATEIMEPSMEPVGVQMPKLNIAIIVQLRIVFMYKYNHQQR